MGRTSMNSAFGQPPDSTRSSTISSLGSIGPPKDGCTRVAGLAVVDDVHRVEDLLTRVAAVIARLAAPSLSRCSHRAR